MIRKTAVSSFVVILLAAMTMLEPASSSAADQRKPLQKDSMSPAAAAPGAPTLAIGMPDLVISDIDFQVVKHTSYASGLPCQIYNLYATVKNQGMAAAKPFDVVIERNKGANGAFELACPTCTIAAAGLAQGESKRLDPRQFNNCTSNNWDTFRVTADPTSRTEPKGKVIERHEDNNFLTKTYVKQSPPPEKKAAPSK